MACGLNGVYLRAFVRGSGIAPMEMCLRLGFAKSFPPRLLCRNAGRFFQSLAPCGGIPVLRLSIVCMLTVVPKSV
jgi:hypothetical protein